MLTADHLSPEFRSECAVRQAALEYNLNVHAFRAGKITADQHRAENRRIRATVTDNEWEQAKFRVLNQL